MSTPFSILTHLNRRHVLGALGLATVAAVGAPLPALAQTSVNLAMIGEPQSLDPMASTADLVSIIMQHVYEPLYTFDDKWVVKPMLASDMPKISADGKTYTIEIRKGVKLHNGRELDSGDVVASLKRWVEMTPRGKALGMEVIVGDASKVELDASFCGAMVQYPDTYGGLTDWSGFVHKAHAHEVLTVACTDLLAYDIAVCLNAWCFESDHSFNVTKAHALLAAYQARRPLSAAECAALPVLCRGASLRFLLTRLYDWTSTPAGALVTRKDPLEYLRKLRFFLRAEGPASLGL
jgi:hypothetical protein